MRSRRPRFPTEPPPPDQPQSRYVAMKPSWSHGDNRRERERDRGREYRGSAHSRRSRSPESRRLEDDKSFDRGSKRRPSSRHDKHRERSQERRRRPSRSPVRRESRERAEVRERNRGRELLEPRGSEKSKRSSHESPSSSKRRKSRSISPSRSHHKRSRRSSFRSPSRPERSSASSKHDRKPRAATPPSTSKRRRDRDIPEPRSEVSTKNQRESTKSDTRGRSPSPRNEQIRPSRQNSVVGLEPELEPKKRDRSSHRSPRRSYKERDTSPSGRPEREIKAGRRERPSKGGRGSFGDRSDRFDHPIRERQSSPRESRVRESRGISPRRERIESRGDHRSDSTRPRSSGGRPTPAASGANSIDVKMSNRGYYGSQKGFTQNPMQAAFPLKQPHNNQGPQGDPRYSQSPQHVAPHSQHGSPQAQSPYSGSWGNQQPQQQYSPHPQYPSNYQQPGFSPPHGPQSHYYGNQSQSPPYAGPPTGPPSGPPTGPMHHQQYPQQGFRGNQRGFRGNNHNSRGNRGDYRGGRGNHHYQNHQWNGGNPAAGRGGHSGSATPQHASPQQSYSAQQSNPATPQQNVPPPPEDDGDDNEDIFRPSKMHQVEDTSKKDDEEKMPPPGRPIPTGPQSQQTTNKFSFAFKASSKAAPTPPKPEISSKLSAGPARPTVPASPDRPRGPAAFTRPVPTEPASARRHEFREPAPPVTRMVKKTMKRELPRPQLTPEFKKSTSVYFRKDGNESVIGSGTYGKVYKAVHVYTKDLVALKKIRMEGERDGFPVTAVREIRLLQHLTHVNVVCLKEVMVENNDCFMVFEYAAHDLTGLLNHPSFKLEPSHKKHLAQQLFTGLAYLHKRGVLHRDIKAANILVSNTGQLKLADFGLARFFEKKKKDLDYTNRVITVWYRPPELLLGETKYGAAVDVWSAACVMAEIFTRHAIFPGDGSEANQLEKIYAVLGTPNTQDWPGLVHTEWFQLLRPNHRRPNTFAEKYKEKVTPAAFELLEAMFQYDPDKRPSAADVLEHPYFTTEKPAAQQATELEALEGDWHEFESKALRKENERKDREARKQAQKAAMMKPPPENEKKRQPEGEDIEPDAKRLQIGPPTAVISKGDPL